MQVALSSSIEKWGFSITGANVSPVSTLCPRYKIILSAVIRWACYCHYPFILSKNKEIHICYAIYTGNHIILSVFLQAYKKSIEFFHSNLHEKNHEITVDNIHKGKMSLFFNFTEAKPVNRTKSIQILRIRLCIWSSEQRSIKTNIFEMLSILFKKCIYLSQSK